MNSEEPSDWWERPPPFSKQTCLDGVNPAVSAQCEEKKERPRTPTRERCERPTLTTTDLSKSGVIFEYRSDNHVPLVSLTKTKRHPAEVAEGNPLPEWLPTIFRKD